jgi:hypothetical protein
MGELHAIRQQQLLNGTKRRRVMRAPEASRASGARVYLRRGPAIVSVCVVAALALTAVLPGEQVEVPGMASHAIPDSPPAVVKRAPTAQFASPSDSSPPPRAAVEWDDDFVAWVKRKYRYLLAEASLLPKEHARLMQLLMEREDAVSLLDPSRRDSDSEVLRIETGLRALLTPAQFATFRLLEDSDEEQHHLLEYTGGVSNVTPLTAQQQRSILEIKLRHKQAYQASLKRLGLERDRLSTAEREYAHSAAAAAMSAYRTDYLQEARLVLEAGQYTLLSDYEKTEFDHELQRLQMTINAK